MRLAVESQRLMEEFLRERFRLETLKLPPLSLYRGRVASWLTNTFRIGAITFGRRIFVAPKMVTPDETGRLKVPGWLVAHEATHVWQYECAGFAGFLSSYLAGYWRALRAQRKWGREARQAAYLAIREECEARESETAYAVWIALRESGPTLDLED
ncbi:MAG TPA: DUF4157 domain-containing protein [Pyrinomonadaceae bacterium]|nr:DUF4157 domain-containing protein [Pyrinomonadaceae bacterium]